ncbi:MAG: heavy metal translocating P-type ATPase [Pseudomonadota bacterium]
MTRYTIPVEGLSCGGCAARAGRALASVPGIADASVNFATASAQFDAEKAEALPRAAHALQEAGYPFASETVTLRLEAMHCAACASRVTRALEAEPGVIEAQVNLAQEVARIRYLPSVTEPSRLAEAVTNAGYPATIRGEERAAAPAENKDHTARAALIAILLTLPVFLVEMGGHLYPPFHHWIARTIGQQTSWLIQAGLTALVLAWPGRTFFRAGIPALRRGAPDMNSLVAMGASAAFLYSLVATLAPGLLPAASRVVYFEAAAVIVSLILLGRFFEARAKGQSNAAIRALIGLQPREARIRRGETVETVPVEAVQPGDIVEIRPGERLPTDGVVVAGESYIDESMITGEPMPALRGPGQPVTGGTVNTTAALDIRATKVGADTVLAQIIRMVEEAQGARLPVQAMVDRITLYFVPAVMAIAALTMIAWLVLGGTLASAVVSGVSVLIIACPCAMGLATPMSILVGSGRAAQLGILFRRGDALEQLSRATWVAFDKTGTLTAGTPRVTDVIMHDPNLSRARLLGLAAAIEARSEHPIGRAICKAAADSADETTRLEAQDVTAHAGLGVSGTVAGHQVTVGSARYMAELGLDAAPSGRGSDVFVAIDGRLAAMLSITDPVRESAAEAVAALREDGVRVAMISGDSLPAAKAVAAQVGITEIHAETMPGDKRDIVAALQKDGPVAFVGDGINDAPALAQADIGIAIGSGTDVAMDAADVVLIGDDPAGVVTARRLSQAVLRNIRQNLAWAFGYNVALIPVAAGLLYPAFGLLLSPMLAAGAMALSSIFVVTNALRLRRLTPVTGPTDQAPDRAKTRAPAPGASPAPAAAAKPSL